jgi:hypothetical protein
VRGAAAAAAIAALLAGCATEPTPAYVSLQNSIKQTITTKDRRPVSSVACTPHVNDVSYSDGYVDLNCTVHFADGTSYVTPATIEARSFQVEGWNFSWDGPGPLDITTAPLPRPTTPVAATSGSSLFYARNLRPVVSALAARFGTNQLILALALYPGELEAVVGANGQARPVTAHSSGALTVGPPTNFDGERSGITISPLDPAVPQRLARLIAAHGGVPAGQLDRFVLTFPGDLAGWDIYPATSGVRFQAHVQGDSLEEVSGSQTRALG